MSGKAPLTQIERLLAEGLTQSEIARQLGVSRQAISCKLLNPRKVDCYKHESVLAAKQEAKELQKQGLSYREIGDMLSVSRTRAYQLCAK